MGDAAQMDRYTAPVESVRARDREGPIALWDCVREFLRQPSPPYLLGAVATAQGFTYRADMSYIYIRHSHQASEQQYPLTATTMIEPGDTIRVTQRYF